VWINGSSTLEHFVLKIMRHMINGTPLNFHNCRREELLVTFFQTRKQGLKR
jgi:hypothetical protein